jgi:adenylate cyclase
VNLTSRIEGQCKAYGAPIIIGSRTVELVGSRFATIELDSIQVKGETEPETIYGLFGAAGLAASDEFRRVRDICSEMLESYRRREWDDALKR